MANTMGYATRSSGNPFFKAAGLRKIALLGCALALMPALTSRLCAEDFPLCLQARWDYPALGLGLAAAGYGFYQEWDNGKKSFDPAQFHASDIPAYDRWAIGYYSRPLSSLSDALIVAGGLAPVAMTLADWHAGRETFGEAWTDAIVYGEVVAYASALSIFSKDLRVHPRPLAFTDKAPYSERSGGDARSSFMSEHTTGAFAAGVFTAYTFQLKHPQSEWTPWVWAGALATASATGALRVFSGKHFPSDVVAGAAVGSLVGYAVPRLHLQARARTETGREAKASGGFSGCELGWEQDANGPMPVLIFRFRG